MSLPPDPRIQDAIANALQELRDHLVRVEVHATSEALRARSRSHARIANHLLATVAADIANASAQQMAETVRNVTHSLQEVRTASQGEVWEQVLKQSKIMLDLLPGDRTSFPDGKLPPV